MRRFLLILVAAVMLTACGKDTTKKVETDDGFKKIEVKPVEVKPVNYEIIDNVNYCFVDLPDGKSFITLYDNKNGEITVRCYMHMDSYNKWIQLDPYFETEISDAFYELLVKAGHENTELESLVDPVDLQSGEFTIITMYWYYGIEL